MKGIIPIATVTLRSGLWRWIWTGKATVSSVCRLWRMAVGSAREGGLLTEWCKPPERIHTEDQLRVTPIRSGDSGIIVRVTMYQYRVTGVEPRILYRPRHRKDFDAGDFFLRNAK